jgi:ABC-type transporter Mla MlaB component
MLTVRIRVSWDFLIYLLDTPTTERPSVLAAWCFDCSWQDSGKNPMLRITVHETPQQITLKLEGSLTGSWVMELEDCWRAASSNPAGRLICLDLTEVDSVDSAGTYLLALLHNREVQLIASGLVMTELVAGIEEQWQLRKEA